MKSEQKYLIGILLSGLFCFVVATVFLWTSPLRLSLRILLSVLMILLWIVPAVILKARVAYSLRTITNMLGALREKDYSFRLKGACRGDVLGELVWETNSLSEILHDERLGAMEATALLRKVMAEIDVAVFGFDENETLCLINESGEKLMGQGAAALLDSPAEALGLSACLAGSAHQIVDLAFPEANGRWELRKAGYREGGAPRQLLFLVDMTQALHKQERAAWKQLIQILRHEINNSLAPIQSVAESLQAHINGNPNLDDGVEDLREGLEIIAERSGILGKFIASYSQLTRLPEPTTEEMCVAEWIEHVAGLEQRVEIKINPGPDATIRADRSQLDQLLINLVSNATEACLEEHSVEECKICIEWVVNGDSLEVWVDDNGPGCNSERDLFVPFFTTKQSGSGIGLALSRQIAEAHGGTLFLANHTDRKGCRAILRLPIP